MQTPAGRCLALHGQQPVHALEHRQLLLFMALFNRLAAAGARAGLGAASSWAGGVAKPSSSAADGQAGVGLDLKTLPLPELGMGLMLVMLSRALAVGSSYSMGRALIMFAFVSLIILYSAFRNPLSPFYCYAFATPILPNFGVGLALIVGGLVLLALNRSTIDWTWRFSRIGLTFCLFNLTSVLWSDKLYFGQDSYFAQAVPPMVVAMVIAGIKGPIFRRNMALLVVVACVIGSFVSLLNWSRGFVEYSGGMRVYSLIGPDGFSAWELLALMGVCGWLVAERPPTWLRVMLVASVPVLLMGLGLSGYRAAIVAAGFGVVLVGVCQRRWFAGALIVGLLIALGCALYAVMPDMFAPVIARFQTIESDRGSDRLDIWQAAFIVFSENPLIGVGCENFRFAIGRYYSEELLAHSIYIGTLVELGVVGFTLLLCWIGVLLRKAWRARDHVWFFPLLVAYLVQGAFLHEFYFGCFWLALGLVEGATAAEQPFKLRQEERARRRMARSRAVYRKTPNV